MISFQTTDQQLIESWSLLAEAVDLLVFKNIDLEEEAPRIDRWHKEKEQSLRLQREYAEKQRQEQERTHKVVLKLRDRMNEEEWRAIRKLALSSSHEGLQLYKYFSIEECEQRFS